MILSRISSVFPFSSASSLERVATFFAFVSAYKSLSTFAEALVFLSVQVLISAFNALILSLIVFLSAAVAFACPYF
jgi:hypothetical protein